MKTAHKMSEILLSRQQMKQPVCCNQQSHGQFCHVSTICKHKIRTATVMHFSPQVRHPMKDNHENPALPLKVNIELI
jgi:hypothetical protein